MTKRMDIMLDCETLGTSAGCVVLTIGAVAFDPYGYEHEIAHRIGTTNGVPAFAVPAPQFACRIDMIDSMMAGLTISRSTMEWWKKQDKASWNHAFEDGVGLPLALALHRFNEWGESFGPDVRVWCHGATFDAPILAAALAAVNLKPFWGYDKVRDTRTVFDLTGEVLHNRNLRWLPTHNALYDAAKQAIVVQRSYRHLEAWKGALRDNLALLARASA